MCSLWRISQRARYTAWTEKQLTDTLNLPKTSFPQRPNINEVEDLHRRAISTKLYHEQSPMAAPFIMHDGPPFANGDLHIGHALNKMLKDTILRHQIERGKYVIMRPGWDCHGLPIELKAVAEVEYPADPLLVRKSCRVFAKEAIERQREEMLQWGLLADYDSPVISMDAEYEARQLDVLASFAEKELVQLGKKPVYWSPSSRTALAEAELEYRDDHRSKAVYVGFPILGRSNEYLLVWTTNPWTIPANQAIGFNPKLSYVQIKLSNGSTYVIALDCLDRVAAMVCQGVDIVQVTPIELGTLSSILYGDITLTRQKNPMVIADFINSESGTGLVHLAPAYGKDDYEVFTSQNGKELKEIVNTDGTFNELAPRELIGKNILESEGIAAVLGYLNSKGCLVATHDHVHKYPYDWRTKRPIIQMATYQWFINIGPVKEQIIKALDHVEFTPETGKSKLISMIKGRTEWCISRQRVWGVPIPVFYFKDGKNYLFDSLTAGYFAEIVRNHGGTDAWWKLDLQNLLPPEYRHLLPELVKGTDTLDVWFDSGTFWTINKDRPADIYIEGGDQYRGWFQSSLITSIVSRGTIPFKRLVSHGFVLDEQGTKMSKSLGNVIKPQDLIHPTQGKSRGTDILRLWAVGANYFNDMLLGEQSINNASETLQKLRSTVRFILGNINDLPKFTKNIMPRVIDQSIMRYSDQIIQKVQGLYDQLDFAKGLDVLRSFIRDDLSAVYFDSVKSRLYVEPADSEARRSAQITLYFILKELMKVLRPIAPFLCEESLAYQKNDFSTGSMESRNCRQPIINWPEIVKLRSVVLSAIYGLRKEGLLSSTSQAIVNCSSIDQLGLPPKELEELFMVSRVTLHHNADAGSKLSSLWHTFLGTEHAFTIHRSTMGKCPRCWLFNSLASATPCPRCSEILFCDLPILEQTSLQ